VEQVDAAERVLVTARGEDQRAERGEVDHEMREHVAGRDRTAATQSPARHHVDDREERDDEQDRHHGQRDAERQRHDERRGLPDHGHRAQLHQLAQVRRRDGAVGRRQRRRDRREEGGKFIRGCARIEGGATARPAAICRASGAQRLI